MTVIRSASLLGALVVACASSAFAAQPSHGAKPFDINELHLNRLVASISCLPHEPETTSTSTPRTAIADGDTVLTQGHCQAAIADYQKAIDADPSDVTALWKQEIAALGQLHSTQDMKIAHDDGEMAYHDADMAVTAHPNAAVFLFLRATARVMLIPMHIRGRSPITLGHYIASENKHSYDDLTEAVKLVPNFGEAYADRWMIDIHNQDLEQAQYDLAQAQKFDPESAQQAQAMQQYHDQRVAEIRADQLRAQIATANAMMGLAAAASGGELIVVPQQR